MSFKVETNFNLTSFKFTKLEGGAVIDIPSADISVTLDDEGLGFLSKAVISSYELCESANSWAQTRLKNIITANSVFFRYLHCEGYIDAEGLLAGKALVDNRGRVELSYEFEDVFSEYRSGMLCFPAHTRRLLQVINDNRENTEHEDLLSSSICLDDWGLETINFQSLSDEEKALRYKLEPMRVVNGGVLIGMVKPEIISSNVVKLDIGKVTLEITGKDVDAFYEAFLSPKQFELFSKGYDVWKNLERVNHAVVDLYHALKTLGYDEELSSFNSKEPLDVTNLSKLLIEHEQKLSSFAALLG
ncbi:hypothetical protein [Photobacterium damselae]|uniref:hypothetical protein n=1 Tax=Photobacterium damselae TaxID=38293 RepID=UPI004067A493